MLQKVSLAVEDCILDHLPSFESGDAILSTVLDSGIDGFCVLTLEMTECNTAGHYLHLGSLSCSDDSIYSDSWHLEALVHHGCDSWYGKGSGLCQELQLADILLRPGSRVIDVEWRDEVIHIFLYRQSGASASRTAFPCIIDSRIDDDSANYAHFMRDQPCYSLIIRLRLAQVIVAFEK